MIMMSVQDVLLTMKKLMKLIECDRFEKLKNLLVEYNQRIITKTASYP